MNRRTFIAGVLAILPAAAHGGVGVIPTIIRPPISGRRARRRERRLREMEERPKTEHEQYLGRRRIMQLLLLPSQMLGV